MIDIQRWDKETLDTFWQVPDSGPLPLLLVRDMCLIAHENGRAPLLTVATRFRNFFRKRAQEGKAELDLSAATQLGAAGRLGEQTVEWWSGTIVEQVLAQVHGNWISRDRDDLIWKPEVWCGWSPAFRKGLRNVAETRLIEYFETRVQGGW